MADSNFKRQIVLAKQGNEILTLSSGVGSCTIDSVNCVVTLSEIEFVNEMYSPAHLTVKATLVRNGQSDSQNGQDAQSLPSYQSVVDFFLLAKASVKAPDEKNALVLVESNLYVHEVRPTYVNNNDAKKLILYLDIYSADKLLTLDKYSKSYVHKRLFGDIISSEVKQFKAGEGEEITISTKDLSARLKYSQKKDEEKALELYHPYLVQYNEPFYDFLARTANRMGEFLYFANGNLTLGVKTPKEGEATQIEDKDYASFSVDSRNNSVRTTRGISRKYTGTEHAMSCNDSTPRYTQPTSNDDYLVIYEKNEFDSWENEYKPGWRFLPLAFSTWFTTPTIGAFIAKTLIDQGKDMIMAGINSGSVNDYYNEHAIEKALGKLEDNSKAVLTGTCREEYIDDWYVNVNADFYNKIDECEKMMSSRTVTITLKGDEAKNYQVGQIVKVSGISYVIAQVKYSEIFDGLNMAYEHILQALPLLNVSIDTEKHKTTLKLTDGLSNSDGNSLNICCPMLLPEERRVRKASPQTAWVYDNEDPKFLGRVRIYYAWDQAGPKEHDTIASPWLRQAEPAAGQGAGFSFRLYKGDEVMIGYENDNIEQPFVIGALFHGEDEKKHKFGPPTGRNKKGGITHQFSNRSGHRMVMSELRNNGAFLAGILPATTMLKGPLMGLDEVNEKGTELAGGFQFTDKYGIYNVQMSTDERLISIASPMGDIKLSAFSGISISAPRGDISISGKNVTIKAANKLTLESGSNAKNTGFEKTKHDDGLITAIGHDITEQALNWVSSMIDLRLLRNAVECIIPPVDGTLQIKSNRYLLLEAGDGTTTIPQTGYNDEVPVGEKDPISYNEYYGGNNTAVKIRQHINLLAAMVTELQVNYVTILNAVKSKVAAYRTAYDGLLAIGLQGNVKDVNHAFNDIKSSIKNKKFNSKVISTNGNRLDGLEGYTDIVKVAGSLWTAIKQLVNFVETRSHKEWAITSKLRYFQDGKLGAAFVEAKKEILTIFGNVFIQEITLDNIDGAIDGIEEIVTRRHPEAIKSVLGKYLIELREKEIIEEKVPIQENEAEGNDAPLAHLTDVIVTNNDLVTFVNRLDFHSTSVSSLKKALNNFTGNQKKNVELWSAKIESGKWGYDRAKFGRILFSDQDKKTYYINNNNIEFATNPNIVEIRREVLSLCGIQQQVIAGEQANENNGI